MWLLYISITIVGLALASIFQRSLLREEQSDPVAYGFIFQFLAGGLLLIYACLEGFTLPPLKPFLPNLLIMGLLYAVGNLLLFRGYQLAEAADISVIFSSRTIWTVVSALIFLSEKITFISGAGIGLIMAGVILISWKKHLSNLNRGHLFVLMASVFFGIAFTNDFYIMPHFGVALYAALSYLLPAFVLLLFRPRAIGKLTLFLKPIRLTKMVTLSFLYTLVSVGFYLAYNAGGKASYITPLSQLSVVLTMVLAYIFLGERDKVVQKVAGALLTLVGVWFLKG